MASLLQPWTKKRPKPEPAAPQGKMVGYLSDQMSGWFNESTGELASGFQVTPDDTMIDVGCGDGGISMFAANRGAAVISTDISPECVEKTKRCLARSKAREFRAEVSDSNPLPVKDNTCTRVVCLEVLEHVADPRQVMSELIRVATPGALFLLACPDPASESVQKDLAPDSYWQHPNHIRVFERQSFDELVTSSGLTILNKSYKSFYWAMWWTLFWAADQDFGAPEVPLLSHWTQTWHLLMKSEKGAKVASTLDKLMPKSQVILAQKPE